MQMQERAYTSPIWYTPPEVAGSEDATERPLWVRS